MGGTPRLRASRTLLGVPSPTPTPRGPPCMEWSEVKPVPCVGSFNLPVVPRCELKQLPILNGQYLLLLLFPMNGPAWRLQARL
eukprot:08177.XXX_251729_251977_1 [CDS] Oithona nana genome sequencing.